jgi:hypothetical protein
MFKRCRHGHGRRHVDISSTGGFEEGLQLTRTGHACLVANGPPVSVQLGILQLRTHLNRVLERDRPRGRPLQTHATGSKHPSLRLVIRGKIPAVGREAYDVWTEEGSSRGYPPRPHGALTVLTLNALVAPGLHCSVKYRIKQEARNAQHIMPDPLTLVYKFNMPRVPPIP